MDTTARVELLISGYESPEGPAFDRDGNLFFVNWTASAIVKLTPEGVATEFFNTGGIPAGLAFHRDGSLWVADEGDAIHGLLRIDPDGSARTVVDAFEGEPLNGANDLVFAADGTLYFSDPWGSSLERPNGGFYRLLPDETLERLDDGLAFPNGVALAADGSAVLLAETQRNRILRYPIGANGRVGAREHFAGTAPPPGPDGMAFDAAGNLYVAHWGGGRVDVFDADGCQIETIPVPGAEPTNVAFGGPDRRTLVVAEVETGALYRVWREVPGQALFADHLG